MIGSKADPAIKSSGSIKLDVQDGRHERARPGCAPPFIPTSHLFARRFEDALGKFGLRGELRVAGSCQGPETGPKTAGQKRRRFLKNSATQCRLVQSLKHLGKMRNPCSPMELRRQFLSKHGRGPKREELQVAGPFQSLDGGGRKPGAEEAEIL